MSGSGLVRAAGRDPSGIRGQRAFGLFGEMLLVGLVVSALALPLVTLLPGLAAGAAHIERVLSDRPSSLRSLAVGVALGIRTAWLPGIGFAAALILLTWNVSLGLSGALPGGNTIAAVSIVLAWIAVMAAGRYAALWSRDSRPQDLIRRAGQLILGDPRGTALMTVALLVCVTVGWMYLPLVLLTPGMFCFAVVVVERRRSREVRS